MASTDLDYQLLLRELAEARQQLAESQQLAHVGHWRFQPHSRLLTFSPEMCRILDLPPERAHPKFAEYRDRIHPDDRQRVLNLLARSALEGGTHAIFYRVKHGDGTIRHLYGVGSVTLDIAGEVVEIRGTTQDVTELIAARGELARNEALLQEAQNLAQVGSFVLEQAPDGLRLLASQKWFEIHGLADVRAAIATAAALASVHPDDRDRVRTAIGEALRGAMVRFDYRSVHSGGEIRYLAASVRPHSGESSVRLVGSVQDMTERKLEELELVKARELALQASKVKSQFLANMSHEIRTPVAGILGMAGLAAETALSAEQRDYVDGILLSARNLLRIVSDVLDLAKIESGKLTVEQIPFACHDLLDETVAGLRRHAIAKGLELDLHVHSEVPLWVRGDPTRLGQVLVNLVDNALKFTAHGRVGVDCQWHAGELTVAVSDTGIGIGAERLEQVFAPFEQADSSTTRRFGGTGLGLTIVRQLLAIMSGTVAVTSELGVGTRFVVTLPAAAAEPTTTTWPRAAESQHLRALRPVQRLLVAEDNPVNAKVLTTWLKKRGYHVDLVGDGAAAVAAVTQGDYDLVLMDVQMPGMDGLEATRTIRARQAPSGQRLPIVALTANAMKGDDQRCREAGMDGYLAKPVAFAELAAALRGLGRSAADADEASDEPAAF